MSRWIPQLPLASPTQLLGLLVAVLLIVPSGVGSLDLCLCQGDQHGGFCGVEDEPSSSPSGCCAQQALPVAEPNSEAPGCPGCPSLELADGLVLSLPDVGRDSLEPTRAAQVALWWESLRPELDHRSAGPEWRSKPPPDQHRLHLTQCVFLC